MSFLLVTKDNLGAVLLLLLVVFLSQSKLLSFFSESKLGRTFIIIFIIFITFCNKSLGIISMLLVIIVFSYMYHGKLFEKKDIGSLSSISINPSSSLKPVKEKIVAKEGADMYSLEDLIRRGKQSNVIPSYVQERKIDIDDLSSFNELSTSLYTSI
jgi:membrane-associated HD superfamily phosphohydrolase